MAGKPCMNKIDLQSRKDVLMRKKQCSILLILLLVVAATAHAEVDAQVVQTLQLKAAPVDLALSGNGRYIYVLTTDAKLQVFKTNGELRDTLPVDPGVKRIESDPREDRLYLINAAGNRIQVLNLSFIHEIPVGGSPTKGSDGAAVTVAVFTDFQ